MQWLKSQILNFPNPGSSELTTSPPAKWADSGSSPQQCKEMLSGADSTGEKF